MQLLKPVVTSRPRVVDTDDRVIEPAWLTVHQPEDPYNFRVYPPFAGLRAEYSFGDHYVTLPEEQYEETILSLGKYNQRLSKAKFHTQQRWSTETHGTVELFLVTTPAGIELTKDLFDFNLKSIDEKFTDVWISKITDPSLLAGFELHYCKPLQRETAWLVVVPKDDATESDFSRISNDLNTLLREILSKRIASLRRMTDELVANGERNTKQYVRLSRILRTLANSQNSKPVRAALVNALMASLPSSLPGMFLYQSLQELKRRDQLEVDYSAYWSLFDPALGRKQFYQKMLERNAIRLDYEYRQGLLFKEDV